VFSASSSVTRQQFAWRCGHLKLYRFSVRDTKYPYDKQLNVECNTF
jgi:hypothetical protein